MTIVESRWGEDYSNTSSVLYRIFHLARDVIGLIN